IEPPLDRDDLFNPFEARLRQVAADGHKHLFYTTAGNIGLWGAGFLTPVPRVLLDIFRDAYRASAGEELVPEGWPMPVATGPDPDLVLHTLAAMTHMPAEDLLELRSLLEDKKQLILEGPPGAGKTYLADLLARWVADEPLEGDTENGRVELVQFHQSYGYEDFVQGLRPRLKDDKVVFEVVDGIFLDLCRRASNDPDNPYVLIIDEINRGNLSRIFGELLMALEYRDKAVRLPYGETPLRIPDNLYLIGTMNSTDRSLALIDYALRRRFYFHRLQPSQDGNAPVYRNWLESRGLPDADRARLHRLFVNLNSEIGRQLSDDFQIGHSYFMRDDIHTTQGLHRIWKHAVTPLLQEYFHTARDRKEALARFTISSRLGRSATDEPATTDDFAAANDEGADQ
ncbi:MAG: McrB family protein, partial [Thermomicrobiales bacterium]